MEHTPNQPQPEPQPPNPEDDDGSGGSIDDGSAQHHPIAEFLYQLTKMLTDDNNEIIEWIDGRIKVHFPERLEGEVLHKYFRHSKFASFQRQLNYFGFRKIAGKGKMSPCSYVNEAASSDIRSLLLIKRKTNGSAARKAALQQQRAAALAANATTHGLVLPAALGHYPSLPPVALDASALALALLQQNSLAGIMPPTRNAPPDFQQLNLLHLQNQLFQKQLLHQQALQQQQQQNQSALSSMLAQQAGASNGTNGMPSSSSSSFATTTTTPNLFHGDASAALPGSSNAVHTAASLEQLQAQLKALTQPPPPPPSTASSSSSSQLTAFLSQIAANQVAAQGQASNARATAALQAQQSSSNHTTNNNSMQQPATAAMNAASTNHHHHLFDSALNLKSLLEEHKAQTEAALQQQQRPGGELHSTLSLGNFQQQLGSGSSSQRLSSLLSLNSFLGASSREASLADFAAATRPPLSAEAVHSQLSAAAAQDKYHRGGGGVNHHGSSNHSHGGH